MESVLWLLVLFGTPALVFALSKTGLLPIKSRLKLGLLSFVILYGFIISMAEFAGYKAERLLHEYMESRNIFSSSQVSTEREAAVEQFANDTGRQFAPITGFIFSSLYVLIFFSVVNFIGIIKEKFSEKHLRDEP